ncbi:MAG TPA: response regulator transcription factor [Anaerolineae bacterium]|nr:response regulator transcription factor [Anaerolineae bacterium]
MNNPIRIFHADDHALVREGVRALIGTEPEMTLVGEADNGADTIEQVLALKPDVILLDLQMPQKSGLEAITTIKETLPDARILVVTSFADDDNVFPAIKAGALGYLLKDSSPEELLHAIRDVYNGRSSLHPIIAHKLIQELNKPSPLPPTEDPLTERELDILRYIAQGLTNQEIADRLVVSERTVRTHVSHILSKLHLANRTQAALYALREGYAQLDD